MLNQSGNHIYFGEAQALIPQMQGPIHCIATDPPFGKDFVSNFATTPLGMERNARIANDDDLEAAIQLFDQCLELSRPFWAEELELYVFTSWDVSPAWHEYLNSVPGLSVKMKLIWEKGWPGLGDLNSNWGCGYEEIFYCKVGRRPIAYRRSGVMHVDRIGNGKNIHPTEKPVSLMEKLIEMSTDVGDLVVDFFSGSGATSVAAQRLGRRSVAFESAERYIEPSRSRLQQGSLF